MRLFVALDIDPEIRRRISEFRDKIRPYAPDVRWVGSESFHITLQFIGESEKVVDIRAAKKQLEDYAARLKDDAAAKKVADAARDLDKKLLGRHRIR